MGSQAGSARWPRKYTGVKMQRARHDERVAKERRFMCYMATLALEAAHVASAA